MKKTSMQSPICISVNITYDCNRDCSFCYVDDSLKGTGTISVNVIDKLVDVYKKYVEQYGLLNHDILTLLGGEPLLYRDLCKEICCRIQKINPNIFTSIFTNGDFLTEDFIKWSKKEKVLILLSANDSSIDFLEERISLVRKYSWRCGLSIALSRNNLLRLDQLFDLSSRYCFGPRMSHLYGGSIDKEYIELYDRVLPMAIERALDKNYLFFPSFFYEMTNPFGYKSYIHTCGKNFFSIEPNGVVRSCPIRGEILGSLFDENFEFVSSMKDYNGPKFDFEGIKECEECEHKLICMGGCPLTKKYAYGNVFNTPSPYCKTFKKVFPLVKEMSRRWIKAGKPIVPVRTWKKSTIERI